MQQLHLVGFTTDLEGLIFSARKGAKSGGYLVTLDERLRATIEDALRQRNGEGADDVVLAADGSVVVRPRRPRPESVLSPREIQARLRAGSSIAEVAEEAGVDEEWVGRFAVPILAEQAQVVGRARRLVFVKPRLGESGLPLGDAVRWNLADKGVRFLDEEFEAAWSAYNLQGTSWVVRFQYVSRQKRHSAEWEVDLREDELFSRNRTASDLAYIDPSRRRRRPPVLEPSPRETPASAGRATSRPEATAAAEPAPAPVAASAPAGSAGMARQPVTRRPAGPTTRAGAPSKPSKPAKAGASRKASKPAKAAKKAGKKAVKKAVKKAGQKATAKAPSRSGAAGPRRSAGAAKASKATKPAKASKTARSTKAGKTAKRAAGPKRARAGTAAKKPGPDHRVAPPDPEALDIAERRSHLARPPSPMKSANRAPAHTVEPYRPQPRPAPSLEREGFRVIEQTGDDGRVHLPPPRREVQQQRRPAPAPERAPRPDRVAEPPPRPAAESRPQAGFVPPPDEADEADARPAPPTPEQRLARRLASREAPRRRSPVPAADDAVWHGPGSGEPAPAVRIRADMAAAATRREAPEGDGAPVRRRRERPLRAR